MNKPDDQTLSSPDLELNFLSVDLRLSGLQEL
jgi:hypothetical protein